jgi:maltose-binding protein MalE
MPHSITRPAALAAAALIAVLPLSVVSCSAAQKAMDCGNTAVTVGNDIGKVGAAYNNSTNDPAAAGRALAGLRTDLDKIGKNAKSTDVSNAVSDMQRQTDKVQQAIDAKQVPDLTPLGDAAGNLTKVCAS